MAVIGRSPPWPRIIHAGLKRCFGLLWAAVLRRSYANSSGRMPSSFISLAVRANQVIRNPMGFIPLERDAADPRTALTTEQILTMGQRAFGAAAQPADVRELAAGAFNSTFRVEFEA